MTASLTTADNSLREIVPARETGQDPCGDRRVSAGDQSVHVIPGGSFAGASRVTDQDQERVGMVLCGFDLAPCAATDRSTERDQQLGQDRDRLGRPDALLRPAPRRTGRAAFTASGSSKPSSLVGGQKCRAAATACLALVAACVDETGFGLVRWAIRPRAGARRTRTALDGPGIAPDLPAHDDTFPSRLRRAVP